MFEIFSKTDNKKIPASPDSTILEATLNAEINHMHVCGGNARCSTCRVYVVEGLNNCLPRNEKEKILAEKVEFPENIRLACQFSPYSLLVLVYIFSLQAVCPKDPNIVFLFHVLVGRFGEGVSLSHF